MILQLTDIHKHYLQDKLEVPVLKNIAFEVEEGKSKHPKMFIKVDFPDPDGPIMATYSPASTSYAMFFKTGTSNLSCK